MCVVGAGAVRLYNCVVLCVTPPRPAAMLAGRSIRTLHTSMPCLLEITAQRMTTGAVVCGMIRGSVRYPPSIPVPTQKGAQEQQCHHRGLV